jgi:c-di-GMP-binding flagellar brake protein YcgR
MSATAPTPIPERRRERRIGVQLPLHVRWTEPNGAAFEERTKSENICRGGVAFVTRRKVGTGASLEIRIPLPGAGSASESEFSTVGRVVHIKDADEPAAVLVGVEFTGPRFRRIFQAETTN